MSWMAYVDRLTDNKELITRAAIHGRDGAQWAASPDFQLGLSEVKALVEAFDNPYTAQSQGIKLQDRSFIILRSDDKSIYAKRGQEGVIAVRTNQAVVIGYYTSPAPPGRCALTVEQVGDYLRSVSY